MLSANHLFLVYTALINSNFQRTHLPGMDLANHTHPNFACPRLVGLALPLAGKGHGPEFVRMAAGGAFGVEGHLPRG
ncbi:hypothetical protein, partial [Myxococcus xanthus]